MRALQTGFLACKQLQPENEHQDIRKLCSVVLENPGKNGRDFLGCSCERRCLRSPWTLSLSTNFYVNFLCKLSVWKLCTSLWGRFFSPLFSAASAGLRNSRDDKDPFRQQQPNHEIKIFWSCFKEALVFLLLPLCRAALSLLVSLKLCGQKCSCIIYEIKHI